MPSCQKWKLGRFPKPVSQDIEGSSPSDGTISSREAICGIWFAALYAAQASSGRRPYGHHFMNTYRDEPEVKWSSFMPALGYALGASTGPILEVGIGNYSTPFLREYALASRRQLVSIETNKEWADLFKHKVKDLISTQHVTDYCEFIKNTPTKWGVAFIDNSPGGAGRAGPFKLLIDNSQFIVVHDFHNENAQAIMPLMDDMEYVVYSEYNPPTLLASKVARVR